MSEVPAFPEEIIQAISRHIASVMHDMLVDGFTVNQQATLAALLAANIAVKWSKPHEMLDAIRDKAGQYATLLLVARS